MGSIIILVRNFSLVLLFADKKSIILIFFHGWFLNKMSSSGEKSFRKLLELAFELLVVWKQLNTIDLESLTLVSFFSMSSCV